MRRAEALVLSEDRRVRRHRPDLAGDVVPVWTDHDGKMLRSRSTQGIEDVRKHRSTCKLVQNFRFRRFHPGSFPGGEDDGDAASCGGRQGGR